MSLLSIVQTVCRRQNLAVPTSVVGSTDEQVIQLQGLLEEEGNDLASRSIWQGLTFEASLTTLALESQGYITNIATDGFRFIINNTIWSRTRRLPVAGPMDAFEWQQLKAMFVNGPYYRFRIRGDELLVNPTPPAGESWYFEYVSENWITDQNLLNPSTTFAADTDICRIPEKLLIAGLRWRWKKEKGLDYAEDFRTYEMQVKDAMGRDGGKTALYMDERARRGPTPGVFVPEGSWDLP